jgi:hypothetical protein
MPNEESTVEQTAGGPGASEPAPAIRDTAVQAPAALAYDERFEQETDWPDEPDELPRRPRRRLLGAGGNPLALALLGVLLLACGFIGGVLVEKGESSSSAPATSSAAGFASRLAALRGSASAAGTAGGTPGSGAGGGFFGRAGGSTGAGATTGQVAYVSGSTLYVTNSEGNTVKVTAAPGVSVTKTVKGDVKGIHPGETVVVTGAAGANGTISAEAIRVGSSGGGLAGLGALFGN